MAALDSLDAATMAGRVTLRAEPITVAMHAESGVENFTAAMRSMAVADFTVVVGSTVVAGSTVAAGNDWVSRTITAGSFALPAVFFCGK